MNAPEQQHMIGAAVKRKEDYRFLTGDGPVHRRRRSSAANHGVFLRSPHAHAKIRSIDIAAAKQSPGVIAIFTGADLAGGERRRIALRLADPQHRRQADERAAASRHRA